MTLRATGTLGEGISCTLLRLTERYCVVYHTVAVPPTLAMDWTRTGGASEAPSA